MRLDDLEGALWPDNSSHRYSSNGGPPGCRMTSSAAVRRGKYPTDSNYGGAKTVYPRSK